MGGLSLWHWLVVVIALSWFWAMALIVRRTGHSGWWVLLNLVPLLGPIAFAWWLAKADWPRLSTGTDGR